MIVLVQCPRCHNRMKYQPKGGMLDGKTKECVYCGYSMSASKYVVTAPPLSRKNALALEDMR